MKSFIQKYEKDVMGSLSGFDRLVFRNRELKKLQLQPRLRKCLHLYHCFFHPQFGFMSAGIQTWFPLPSGCASTAESGSPGKWPSRESPVSKGAMVLPG
jgi:hypothetical protein